MTDEEKIAGAAEMIRTEFGRRGQYVAINQATEIAKQLFQFWRERVEINHLPPGQVAQRMRERYDGHPDHDQPAS